MVINVAQASSLHRQDAYATLILILLITTKSEEPLQLSPRSPENR
jgi:hypothetical protein